MEKNKGELPNKEREKKYLKIQFYIMSLWLLFLLIFVCTVDCSPIHDKDGESIRIIELVSKNWIAFGALLLCILGLIFTKKVQYNWKGVSNPACIVKKVKNENFEYLTFLTTCIVPLVCMDLEKRRYVIVLVILLIVIGVIFIKMDLYYGNPTLALLGYRLYRAEIEGSDTPDGIIIITRDSIHSNDSIRWIPIDNGVWMVKVIDK